MSEPALNNFDFIAPVYDALARVVYGQAQKKAQAHFLSYIPDNAKVLILGGGSGWILTEILRGAKPSEVLFLEASAQMLQKAQDNYNQNFPATEVLVEFRHGTEAALAFTETFDVILTPFVLDLFSFAEMQHIIKRLHQALIPSGIWLHTDFHASPRMTHRLWQKLLLWGMYRFFRLVSHISASDLPAFDTAFQELGYQVKAEAYFYSRFIKAQVLQKVMLR